MSKSKWYQWLFNPIGSLVNDLTQGSNEHSVAGSISRILNPGRSVVEGIRNVFDSDSNKSKTQRDIEYQAQRLGMTTEEYLNAHPELLKTYENGDGVTDKINSYIDTLTGERDTAENEKNREFQHNEAELARQWEEEQAQIAREWDSIGSQMERASSVGVNPLSIAMQNGGINGSLGTSIPSSPGIPAGSSGLLHNGILDIAGSIFSGIGTLAENRLRQSQADDIVAMRQYNIAEKMANTDYLRQLGQQVGLSNVAQTIQNKWLNIMNQATYDGMLLDNGVKRETILEKRSIVKLNLKQVDSIDQNMKLSLQKFNATLPLELQLMEADIDFKKMSAKEVYEEICLRHLQSIEQESRNKQASAEAEGAEVATNLAKATYEDAISAFHNDMVKGASEAGISYNDYVYYGLRPGSIGNLPGSLIIQGNQRKQRKHNWSLQPTWNPNIQGLTVEP